MSNNKIEFKVIYLPQNQGHGNARRISVQECTHELVALMDADDVSLSERFARQLVEFEKDKELAIVGGQITEFSGDENHIVARRVVPTTDAEIKEYVRKRCPMNQVTVMFRKQAYDDAGGYIDWYCEEDYYLWIRMIQSGFKFANVPETLVDVRVGDEMSARRGGLRYFFSEEKIQRYMLKQKMISLPRYIYNVAIRFGGEVVLPARARTRLFKLFRDTVETSVDFESSRDSRVMNTPFSVAMCVYGKDNAEWFDEALCSIIEQSVRPSEIVLVVDGPISQKIQDIIHKYTHICEGKI